MRQLEIGDVLLLPKEEAPGVYTFLRDKVGKHVADFLAAIENHRYIHAELYVGGGYNLAAWFDGVRYVSYPLRLLDKFHVYRHPDMDTEKREKLKEIILKYFNKPYDFPSLILNGLPEILSLGIEPLERWIEERIPYDNPDRLICSELVARIYREIGLPIESRDEFVTPDDLAEKLERIA